jgi:uncharacterized protein (DUF305 family)
MRKFLVGASAAAVLALIAGCGSSGNATTPGMDHGQSMTTQSSSRAAENEASNADDVSFAQGMIPHHAQAVEMAKLAPSRSTNAKVLDLASRIQRAQDPEIQQLTAMLTKWGAAPAASEPSMPGMDHGSMSGGMGTMTAEEMKQLEQAKGAEFDRMWTQMMIKHHEGAIEMAKAELAKGTSSEAKSLAQKIIDAQQAEITEMQALQK